MLVYLLGRKDVYMLQQELLDELNNLKDELSSIDFNKYHSDTELELIQSIKIKALTLIDKLLTALNKKEGVRSQLVIAFVESITALLDTLQRMSEGALRSRLQLSTTKLRVISEQNKVIAKQGGDTSLDIDAILEETQ